MNTYDQLVNLLRLSIHEFVYLCRKTWKLLAQLPLPHLFAACLATALLISILPLAISLFMLFLLFKIVSFLVVLAVRKQTKNPRQIH